jgi:hypothetical protein
MALVIYRCKACNSTRRVAYVSKRYHAGYGRYEYAYYRADNGAIGPGGEVCCGKPMKFGFLDAVLKPSVKCDARCIHAKGFKCECSCSGENHASGGMFTSLLAA